MVTVNELFSGIGSQRKALERLGIDFKIVGISEIDKFAIKSYESIYGKTRNYGDISKIEKLDYADFWTYSFPCTDVSIAGKQQGLVRGKTRSGLLYEVERLLKKSYEDSELPKYLMLENVKNLVGKKFKPYFDEWINELEDIGYNTYWKVLDASDYGIPQHRERIFAISIRKDIDKGFMFPEPKVNNLCFSDLLLNDDEIDKRYYFSSELVEKFISKNKNGKQGFIPKGQDIQISRPLSSREHRAAGWEKDNAPTLCARNYKDPMVIAKPINKINVIGSLKGLEPQFSSFDRISRVYSAKGICPTLTTMGGGNTEPKIFYQMKDTDLINFKDYIYENFVIRKITPKESWRLMGFDDEDFNKAQKVCSSSQLLKQAGNSIVVNVLYYIFKNLFNEN